MQWLLTAVKGKIELINSKMQVESGVQLFKRTSSSRSYSLEGINKTVFKKEQDPHQNQIIEVVGPFHNEFIIDLMVRCILPKEVNPEWKNLGVVFLCNDHHINILKVTQTMDTHVKKMQIKHRRQIIETALKNMTILKCYHQEQLELTLHNLTKIVNDRENVSLLVVDNIAPYYWKENKKFESYCKNKLNELQTIMNNLNLVLVFSRQQFGSSIFHLNVDYKIICGKSDSLTVVNNENEQVYTIKIHLENSIITFSE